MKIIVNRCVANYRLSQIQWRPLSGRISQGGHTLRPPPPPGALNTSFVYFECHHLPTLSPTHCGGSRLAVTRGPRLRALSTNRQTAQVATGWHQLVEAAWVPGYRRVICSLRNTLLHNLWLRKETCFFRWTKFYKFIMTIREIWFNIPIKVTKPNGIIK